MMFTQSLKDELARLQNEYHEVYNLRMLAERFGGEVDRFEKNLKLCQKRQKAVLGLLKLYGALE